LAFVRTDQEKAKYTFLKMYNNQEGYRNWMVSWKNWRSEWYKETTIRWRTSTDDDKKVEMMRVPSQLGLLNDPKRRRLSLVLWLNQRVTPQCPK
jgi:hypothetical protein